MSITARRLIAILAALIVAAIIVFGIEAISASVHPLPASVDPTDPETFKRALEAGQIPLVKLGLIVLGWLLAAYAGGLVAIRWSEWPPAVWIFTALFTIFVWHNLSTFSHPNWMWYGGLIGAPLFALGGGRQSLAMPKP